MSLRARRTRDRILEASLGLFNQRGAPHVSTNDIAQELGMSPGNLYYHFRHKGDIVAELFARFRARADAILAVPAGRGTHVEDVWLFLHLLFEHVRDHRFLFRDLDELVSRDRRLRLALAGVVTGIARTTGDLLRGLRASGELRAADEEIDALAESVAMTATYWLSYQALRPFPEAGGDAVGRGVYQALVAVAPFLRGKSRSLLAGLARRYLD